MTLINMYPTMLERFIRYAKINTRSDLKSTSIPTTKSQWEFLEMLRCELVEYGFQKVELDSEDSYLVALLPSNLEEGSAVPAIGFIAHVDTADFNAENINPQIHENYNGEDVVLNAKKDLVMTVSEFPNLKNYVSETLITTDGTTLLGADDKAGLVSVLEACLYLMANPEIPHGDIWLAFGPDEEIGKGAHRFKADRMPAKFAYTLDSGVVGKLEYETFNAAGGTVTLKGVSVHTGTAKGIMINCAKLAMQFDALLPRPSVPEHTCARQRFFMLITMETQVDRGEMNYIIRDHDKELFEAKKAFFLQAGQTLNEIYGREVCEVSVKDQYYNMYDIIKDNMECVNVAKAAMEKAGITPICDPIRGGTDGSKISFMGIPTPNIFTGVENLHGRHEFACIDDMKKAVEVIVNIVNIEK